MDTYSRTKETWSNMSSRVIAELGFGYRVYGWLRFVLGFRVQGLGFRV